MICEYLIFRDEDGNKGIPPVYQTKLAACADVAMPKRIIVPPLSTAKIDLLIGFSIPDNMKIIMYPRSSLLIKKRVIQPVSIIDADYSGQHVHIPLYNPTNSSIIFEGGERVAQIECVPRYDVASWNRKEEERIGGFGSTGVKDE